MNAVPTARENPDTLGLVVRIGGHCASHWDINAVWQLRHDVRAAMAAGTADADGLDALRAIEAVLDACVVGTDYYNKATPELCAAQNGTFIDGVWWYVFAPIALAFALSYTHGNFTGVFWDLFGLKAKK